MRLVVVAAALTGFLATPAFVSTQTQPAPSASLAPPADAPPPHPVAPGPYAVSVISEPTLTTHTVYRPTDLSPFTAGRRLPIVAWGNGACSNAGLLFETFLTHIAGHGFLVVASGPKDAPLPAFASRVPGQARSQPDPNAGIAAGSTKDEDLIKAIDWAIAEDGKSGSAYAGKLDPQKVADPMNLRIIIDTINHPYSNVHAKYWDRWGEKNDVQRGVRVMLAGGFKGTFALEYEAGPLNGVEGAKYLYKEVLAALAAPL